MAVLGIYAAVLLLYSQTLCFTWDEGYHLIAAQLIAAGKKPYIDFCFPQTPLNAYWNAGWMRALGESWRVPHAIAALLTAGAVLLTADYVFIRFPVANWRLAAACATALATGLNAAVFTYGPVAQAYGMCLFTLAIAFRIAIRSVDGDGALLAAACGLFAGAAAASSLLSAAAAPALLVWMLWYNHRGSRWGKLFAFAAAALLPFAPVAWLFFQGPRQTWFNLVRYHASFRQLYWPDTTRHDVEILTSWIDSGQALLLGLLAFAGLVFVARESKWPPALKAEFYLCAWLAAALFAEIACAHPTFSRYFLLGVPFLAILAAPGLYALALRLLNRPRPLFAAAVVAIFFALGLGKALYDRRDTRRWGEFEDMARIVNRLTPRGAPIFANEEIYFLTRRTPPSGYELTSYTHRIDLPPAEAALLHILNQREVARQVKAGGFATAATCYDYEIEDYGLVDVYSHSMEKYDCTIFWGVKAAHP